MTTEWLLSSHNTQESSGVATPMTLTALSAAVNTQLLWFLEQLGGDLSDFEPPKEAITLVQGRGYGNMTFYARNMNRVLPTDPESVGVPKEVFPEMAKPSIRRLILLPFRLYRTYRWMVRYAEQDLPTFEREIQTRYQQLRAGKLPFHELWALYEPDFLEQCTLVDRARIMAAVMVMVLDNLLRAQAPQLLNLFTGLETSTSLLGQRIWDLRNVALSCGDEVVQRLRQGETSLEAFRTLPEAAPFVAAVEAFLAEYGHRGFERELDFEAQRLADRPDLILLAIAGQLDLTQPPTQRARSSRDESDHAMRQMNFIKRRLWQRALAWGQRLIARRERFKSDLALIQAMFGLAVRQLARETYPDQPDDTLFFYTYPEFLEFVRSRGKKRIPMEVIEHRREELTLHRNQPPPPELIWYNPATQHWRPVFETQAASTQASASTTFKGIPASAGKGPVEGIALVTNDPLDAARRLLAMSGHVILVTRLTDPAWSSLFGRLAGVVTELGGVISHAAIVARENGLPAVVGVADITHHVRNGQRLRIDGMTGVVEILD